MTDCFVTEAEEVKNFVIQLFDKGGPYGTEEWKTLTPTEIGIVSWHLDNFYIYPLWWIEDQ